MSSDNFYTVKGNKVFMGSMSDFCYEEERAIAKFERRYFDRMARERPYHIADSHEAAVEWAHSEYSEYGVMDVVEELSELRLRDHSQPCEDGYRYTHIYTERDERPDLGGAFIRSENCPGGKEIVLRKADLVDSFHPLHGKVYVEKVVEE